MDKLPMCRLEAGCVAYLAAADLLLHTASAKIGRSNYRNTYD